MKIGNYYLNQNISEIKADLLEDVSDTMFGFGSIIKVFEGEKIFRGKSITFLGDIWNVYIDIIDDKIFKIALRLESSYIPVISKNFYISKDKSLIFTTTRKHFNNKYGEPDEVKKSEHSNFYFWNIKEGNAILEIGRELENRNMFNILNIFLTSNQPFKNHKPLLGSIDKINKIIK